TLHSRSRHVVLLRREGEVTIAHLHSANFGPLPMSDRLRISSMWGRRFAEQKIALPALLRRAGLPAGLFEQEKVYVTTAELFALWRSVGEMSSDAGIGLKLGAETRLARTHPAGIA